MLSFDTLRKANIIRVGLFTNNKGEIAHSKSDGSDWSPAQWLQAVVGELGEYANLRKKVERGDFSEEEAHQEMADELADVMIYLDLLAHHIGVDLGQAVTDKFNLKSIQKNLPVFIDGNIVKEFIDD